MDIQSLRPNPKNPRKITDPKLEMLKKALNEFGDLSGIVFNRRTKQLVGGHQRMKALPKAAGLKITKSYSEPTRTGTVAQGYVELDGERFVYREVDWDETREKAANIAANKHGGEWDLPALNEWLLELDAANFDLDLTGFDKSELADLMAPITQVEGQCDEDEVPEVREEPKTRLGDIYQLGKHRLMCGDSTSIDAVERLMEGEKADMVFTDPPYGMKLDTHYRRDNWGSRPNAHSGKNQGNNYSRVAGDHDDFTPELIQTVFAAFPECSEVFLWGADYYADHIPGRNEGSWIVWDKVTNRHGDVSGCAEFHGSNFELCWSKARHKRDLARVMHKGLASVDKDQRVHPTQKPVQLAEWFFERWGKIQDRVVDLFGGSGSTLIACEKTNRRCFMMELDPRYCDVIVARWEKFTGKQAKLLTAEATA